MQMQRHWLPQKRQAKDLVEYVNLRIILKIKRSNAKGKPQKAHDVSE
jgi:hypothetical protein